ncbi:PrsW family intramembrane metalloprotease [Halobacterium bonnevillei]|uniref:PrsW family intramembrane metalloprotease n=1 Tax=Halobacterium bonnevillei TaxID=2692200 RepID=A0A6B0SKV5_9EURY|nr:PrsW family intramembrane metalloprotease [Halobacterium bonnevillei]MXR20173.1 PrsW family intramembrane metalloprotease [Halobacterium bonnevillei]
MNPRSVLRIARWETTRSAGDVDRRTAVAFVVVLLVIAALVPALVAYGPTPGEGIYRVGVDDDDDYRGVVAAEATLAAVDPASSGVRTGDADLLVGDGGFVWADSAKGRASLAALRSATVAFNDRRMAGEDNQSAAFPVVVTLTYADQSVSVTGQQTGDDAGADAGDQADDTGDQTGDGTSDGTDGGTDDGTAGTEQPDSERDDDGSEAVSDLPSAPEGGLGGLLGEQQTGTPSSLSPPFPLRSLILAFAFLLPLNVVIQAYGSSVLAERINRRGEPLLVAPVSPADIVAGKTLPYLAGALALIAGIAVLVGAGPLAVAARAAGPLFLAATFLGAMLARSYKELTFVTVTISVTLTAYAFVPAVFAEVHPIASISPLTVVVDSITGEGTTAGAFVLSTVPPALAATVMFGLGTGVYREEDMFTQRPIPAKLLDALAAPLDSRLRVGLWTALFMPFVFVAELFAVAVLFVAPVELSVPLLLGTVALVEELAKSLHVYAGFERGRFPRTLRTSLVLGALSGAGFFLGEKLLLLTQLVGLPGIEVAQFAFSPSVVGLPPGVLLVAPLVLHVVTAGISAVGAARGRVAYALTVLLAVLVHVAYNVAVVVGVA